MRKCNINLATISRWHITYNVKYFGGSLCTPKFEISHSTRSLGRFKCNYRVGLWAKIAYNETIIISNYYNRSEREFQETMLHEMIHQWQAETYGVADHGATFKRKAAEINRDGWAISRLSNIEDRTAAEGVTARKAANENTPVYLLRLKWSDGKDYFAFATLKWGERIMRWATETPKNMETYRTLKVYKVNKDAALRVFRTSRSKTAWYQLDKYEERVKHLFGGEDVFDKPWWRNAKEKVSLAYAV